MMISIIYLRNIKENITTVIGQQNATINEKAKEEAQDSMWYSLCLLKSYIA